MRVAALLLLCLAMPQAFAQTADVLAVSINSITFDPQTGVAALAFTASNVSAANATATITFDLLDATTNAVVADNIVPPDSRAIAAHSEIPITRNIDLAGKTTGSKNYYIKITAAGFGGETDLSDNTAKALVTVPKSVQTLNVDETNVLLLPLVFLTVLGLILFRK